MFAVRWCVAVAWAAGVGLLAACGGGSGEEADPGAVTLDATRTATATIGSAGGVLTATAADGRVYTLSVPAGALATDTEITATPVSSMGSAPLAAGVKGAVRFGPAGLTFAFPATLRIQGAGTTAAAGRRLVGFVRSDDGARMQLMPAGAVDGALELLVPHFSDAGTSEATPAELALVPPTTPQTVAEQIMQDLMVRVGSLPNGAPAADLAAAFAGTIDTVVVPLQAAAAPSTDPDVREAGVAAFAQLAHGLELGIDDPAVRRQVLGLLDGRVEAVRAAAGALLKADFEAGLAACAAPGPFGNGHELGLNLAAGVTALVKIYDVAAGRIGMSLQQADLGLDVDTLRRRLNDCARVVFVPQTTPAFVAGRSVSLDQRAALVYAVDTTFERTDPFEFTVSGTDADVAHASGFSDLEGLYTTVVTPLGAQAQFDTRACWVALLRNGAPVASELCGTQTLPESTGPQRITFAGPIDQSRVAPDQTDTTHVDVSLLTQLGATDDTLQVLNASGTFTRRIVTTSQCRPAPGEALRDIQTELDAGMQISAVSYTAARPGLGIVGTLRLVGTQTGTSQSLLSRDTSCEIVTAPLSSSGEYTVQVLSIRRDETGRPNAMLVGSAIQGVFGTLLRQ